MHSKPKGTQVDHIHMKKVFLLLSAKEFINKSLTHNSGRYFCERPILIKLEDLAPFSKELQTKKSRECYDTLIKFYKKYSLNNYTFHSAHVIT